MAGLCVVPKNDHDDATLLPSAPEVAGFEIENTQNTQRNKFMRTTSAAAWSFTGVLPAVRVASHFSMWRHLNHAGNIKLELFTDDGASVPATPFASSGVVSCVPYSGVGGYVWSDGTTDALRSAMGFYLWFAPTPYRSYRVTLSGTPAQAYWQAARFWLGRYLECGRTASYGLQFGQDSVSDAVRSQGGDLVTSIGATWRRLTFDLNVKTDAEFIDWVAIRDYALTAREIVVSLFQGNGTLKEALHTVPGRLTSLNDLGRPTRVVTNHMVIEES